MVVGDRGQEFQPEMVLKNKWIEILVLDKVVAQWYVSVTYGMFVEILLHDDDCDYGDCEVIVRNVLSEK